jgi:hypothetical protein
MDYRFLSRGQWLTMSELRRRLQTWGAPRLAAARADCRIV